MAGTTTVTMRIGEDLRDQLDRLAVATRRSRSFLAAEALSQYVGHELSIVEGIERGRADFAAGRVVPHKQAMAELRARVKRTAAQARKKSA